MIEHLTDHLHVSLVDLIKERCEDFLGKFITDAVNFGHNTLIKIAFIISKLLLDLKLLIQLLDNTDVYLIVASIMLSQYLLLFLRCNVQSFNNQPAAFSMTMLKLAS